MIRLTRITTACTLVVALAGGLAFAGTQSMEIPWHSIDGGGVLQSTGGNLVLSGTLGQHDPNDSATREQECQVDFLDRIQAAGR